MSILQMNLSAACIIAAIIVMRTAALDKLPKQLFQLLWLIPVIRLFVPFSFSSPISIFCLFERTPVQEMTGSFLSSGSIGGGKADLALRSGSSFLCMAVWITGSVILAACFTIVNVQSRRGFASSVPAGNENIDRWLAQHRIRRQISVRVSDRITTPLTYGVAKPVILLPASLECSGEAQLNYVLLHEFLHIRRLDILKSIVMLITVCIYWFNPMVWIMYVLVNRDIELACDEGVLKESGISTRASYALTLIQMQENRGGAGLAKSFSRYAIKERIESIMKYKKASVTAVAAALALAAGITTAFASSAAATETIKAEEMESSVSSESVDAVLEAEEQEGPRTESVSGAAAAEAIKAEETESLATSESVDAVAEPENQEGSSTDQVEYATITADDDGEKSSDGYDSDVAAVEEAEVHVDGKAWSGTITQENKEKTVHDLQETQSILEAENVQ
ncbi:M56 family metallopeptidase [Ruminococcus gauvreauii]|uniref:M56 family metallopeptidase n=1 Tax=Ruminococcus gauvreauii TaxID=438033 RepID=A0ABY5VIA1_9FIRM|nr:M56 family metallopeptidase [Ruminococcus gauvreauii]UWP60299.1 M56 family metallopeptidase [Ruminococcus gauvreauii]